MLILPSDKRNYIDSNLIRLRKSGTRYMYLPQNRGDGFYIKDEDYLEGGSFTDILGNVISFVKDNKDLIKEIPTAVN